MPTARGASFTTQPALSSPSYTTYTAAAWVNNWQTHGHNWGTTFQTTPSNEASPPVYITYTAANWHNAYADHAHAWFMDPAFTTYYLQGSTVIGDGGDEIPPSAAGGGITIYG